MRMLPRRLLAVCAIVAIAPLGLTACTASKPTPTRTTSASSSQTPVFDSDEAALKAATTAYAAYLKMLDVVLSDGGSEPDRLKAVAQGDALADAMEAAKQYRSRGLRSTGATTFDSTKVQSTGTDSATLYLCEDVTNIDVVDASGKSLVKADRKPRTPFVVMITRLNGHDVISQREPWQGESFC